MSHIHHNNLTVDSEYDYRDRISEALWKEEYVEYAYGDGPLTVDELPAALKNSDAFHQFVEQFGWPDIQDGSIEPLPFQDREFDSRAADEFLERFLSRNSLDPSTNLNNFRMWLTSTPHEHSHSDDSSITDIYGAHPALHRLYVLMPEVMEALRMLLTDIESECEGSRRRIADTLGRGSNSEIVKAIMIVYEVAGRLLKVDDMRRQQQILFPDKPLTMPDITDAHVALSQ